MSCWKESRAGIACASHVRLGQHFNAANKVITLYEKYFRLLSEKKIDAALDVHRDLVAARAEWDKTVAEVLRSAT